MARAWNAISLISGHGAELRNEHVDSDSKSVADGLSPDLTPSDIWQVKELS